MSTSLARTADGWWAVTPAGLVRLGLPASTTAGLLADPAALAAGNEYLKEHCYQHSWGIGRHIEGSQIFDYWRDPDGFLVEHFTDGDVFDNTLEPGWNTFSASGLRQWGPPATSDFLGTKPGLATVGELAGVVNALRGDNEFTIQRVRGLLKGARS